MPLATVKGGFWDESTGGYTPISSSTGKNPIKRRIARLYGRQSLRALREVTETLNGAAAGETASASHKRILARESTDGQVGGKRTIETVVDVSRATVAADVTEILEDILSYPLATTTYPINKDRNPRNMPGWK